MECARADPVGGMGGKGGFFSPETTTRFATGFSRSSLCVDCLAGTYGNSSGALRGVRVEVAFQVLWSALWVMGQFEVK